MAENGKAPRLKKIPTIKDIRASWNAGSSKGSKSLKKKVTKSISGLRNAFQRDASQDPCPPVMAKSPSAQSVMEPLLAGRDGSASSTAVYSPSQEEGKVDGGDEGKYENKMDIGPFFARFQEAVQLARDKHTDECHAECLKLLQARISDGLRYEVLMLMTSISAHREALARVDQLKKHCAVMEHNAELIKRQIQQQGEVWDG